MAKNKMQKKTLWLVENAMLSAILILMAFTPLGYLKTAGLEITFNMIPVVIGAVIAGPSSGALLGLVFGLTSFAQCFGMSAFGVTLLGINPILTFLVCVPTRTLAGWLVGLIGKAITKDGTRQYLSAAVSCFCGSVFNTLFFMSMLILCFRTTEFIQSLMSQMGAQNILKFVVAFVGVNGVVEAAVCFVLGTAICSALIKALSKRR